MLNLTQLGMGQFENSEGQPLTSLWDDVEGWDKWVDIEFVSLTEKLFGHLLVNILRVFRNLGRQSFALFYQEIAEVGQQDRPMHVVEQTWMLLLKLQ